jgi:hypothetical protein
MKIKGVKRMVCRDAYTRAINYWAGSPDFRGGTKLQLTGYAVSPSSLSPLSTFLI